MKGRTPNKEEKMYMNKVGQLYCIACIKDDRINHEVLIHHVDGRTKPGAHYKILPLCANHHMQDDTDPLSRVAVHPNKKRFEQLYGSSESLVNEVKRMVDFQ